MPFVTHSEKMHHGLVLPARLAALPESPTVDQKLVLDKDTMLLEWADDTSSGGGLVDHAHDGVDAQKLLQANAHESADTDSATSALHHTLGTAALQAAAGNHSHGSEVTGWDEAVQTADQTRTNSLVYLDSTYLVLPATAGKHYACRFFVLYSGSDTAVDMKWIWSLPGGLPLPYRMAGGYWWVQSTGNVSGLTHTVGGGSGWPSGTPTAGTEASHSICVLHGQFMFRATSSGNVVFQFANNTSGVGAETTLRTGSLLQMRQLD
jgi:hypothetical protein